jgi:hypothetical protein
VGGGIAHLIGIEARSDRIVYPGTGADEETGDGIGVTGNKQRGTRHLEGEGDEKTTRMERDEISPGRNSNLWRWNCR